VTVVLRHNEKLELNLAEYQGSVTLGELVAMADFQGAHPALIAYDAISVIRPGAEFSSIDMSNLYNVFARYRELFRPLSLVILRRSAWVCESPAAEAHVRYWIGGHDTRQSLSSDLRRFQTIAEAAEWLLLDVGATRALQNGEGFAELARFSLPPGVSR